MARPLAILHPMQKLHFLSAPFTFFIVLTAVVSVFSAVTFLCGSHIHGGEKKKMVRLGGESKPAAVEKVGISRLSKKAILMAKMIPWGKVEEEFDHDDGSAVWKKTIIKGEKCRPLDFSGRILYDSDGNILPE